jgi:hypothetical protein
MAATNKKQYSRMLKSYAMLVYKPMFTLQEVKAYALATDSLLSEEEIECRLYEVKMQESEK